MALQKSYNHKMKDLRTALKNERLYFDGGFGTVIQSMGLQKGTPPEDWNLTNPQKISAVHKAYIDAGSNIITTNTFGVNCDKYDNYEELISSAVNCVKTAIGSRSDIFIAFDIGPTGRMLKPLGDLDFEDAVKIFKKNVSAAAVCGVDCIIIETMSDAYETKAAVVAAKEASDLPILVTNAYDKTGKLMTGADAKAMIALLEGLSVDAIGMNCSFGPDIMLKHIDDFCENCSVPLIANPNAGLPKVENGKTVYDITPDQFADYMTQLANKGVNILGGCCGTTPDHIRKTIEATKNIPITKPTEKNKTVVSSYTHSVEICNQPILIGERINPTGKSKLKEALRTNNLSYILNEGIRQADSGVHILDVNVGLPEINEAQMMCSVIKELQAVTDLPLQIDTSDPEVLEKSIRIYNGKALINSVNGEVQSMNAVFPLVKKYGGTVIALTMDKNGIPSTAEERVKIAERIAECAKEYGIQKKDLIIDPLCLTISSDSSSALITLKSVKLLSEAGFKTSLGVSNISFGLPAREKINTTFFAEALAIGLNCAIMNPFSTAMMDVYYAYRALHGLDDACLDYINYSSNVYEPIKAAVTEETTLSKAIIKGLKDDISRCISELLKTTKPLDIIDNYIIPALSEVGNDFEAKKLYLPQLLMSAECASSAFEMLKMHMGKQNISNDKSVILATVKGDIHDIGKNIVKVLLESYGFLVYDLGRDVSPEAVLDCVKSTGCKLVGLSALMTTTVPSMAETIKLLQSKAKDVKVIVGGAVLNEEYAKTISADAYCKDAMEAVKFATEFYL